MKAQASLLFVALGCFTPSARAAPRPVYGGEVVAYVFGAAVSLNPRAAPRIADRTAQAAVFEPLYRLDDEDRLVPALAAGPPEVEGRVVFVPLRRGVRLHDGRALSPALAAAALAAKADGPGAHVLAPLAGFAEGRPAVRPDPARHGLLFELIAPYPAFGRLLASAHAALAVPSADARRDVGTGPFTLAERGARGGLRLVPFERHWLGRPYLDALELRVHASRSSAAAWVRREEPYILLEAPDTRGGPPAAPLPARTPLARRLLRVSDPALAPLVDRALVRGRLVRRFMDAAAQPTRRLLPGLPAPPTPEIEASFSAPVDLVVSQTDRLGWQFAKRLQLDLLRGGLSATLRRVDAEDLTRRFVDPGGALVLAAVLPDAPQTDRPEDGLQALLSIAAASGAPRVVSEAELSVFFAADEGERARLLDELEARVRARLGLVPIALRPPGLSLRANVDGLRLDAQGALHFEDATRAEPAP